MIWLAEVSVEHERRRGSSELERGPTEPEVEHESKNRIVGHNSGTPVRILLHGKPVAAIHENETITAPSYRRQGILTGIAAECYQSWNEAGYRIIYGLPWGSYGGRLQALGWKPLLPMIWMRRWVLPERALARRLKLSAPIREAVAAARPWSRLVPDPLGQADSNGRETIRVRELAEAEPIIDRLWESTAHDWEHMVVRDREWLQWRYFESPDFRYRVFLAERGTRPAGYLVLNTQRLPNAASRGWIADLFGPRSDREARRALLHEALVLFRQERIELASALVAQGSQVDGELLAAGFAHDAGGDVCIIPLDPELDCAGLDCPAAWHLMGGDFDVV
jgi:hypothetical protein